MKRAILAVFLMAGVALAGGPITPPGVQINGLATNNNVMVYSDGALIDSGVAPTNLVSVTNLTADIAANTASVTAANYTNSLQYLKTESDDRYVELVADNWADVSNSATQKVYNIFMIGGQSNTGTVSNNAEIVSLGLDQPQTDVLFSYWIRSTTPSGTYSNELTYLQPVQSTKWGSEISAGRALADAGEDVCIIKVASDGRGLNDYFIPGKEHYTDLTNQIAVCTDAITALGHTYVFREFWWVGSEGDCNAGDAPLQAANLELLRDGLIDFTGESNLIFKVARVHEDWDAGTGVQEQQNLFATNGLNRSIFSCDDFERVAYPSSPAHYSGASQIELGYRWVGKSESPKTINDVEFEGSVEFGSLIVGNENVNDRYSTLAINDTVYIEDDIIREVFYDYDNCVLWTGFNPVSNNYFDLSLDSHIILTNGETFTAFDRPTGESSYIVAGLNNAPYSDALPGLEITNTATFTISLWIKDADTIGNNEAAMLFSHGEWGTTGSWYISLYDNGSDGMILWGKHWTPSVQQILGKFQLSSLPVASAGGWHMITLAFDFPSLELTTYIDGQNPQVKSIDNHTFSGASNGLYFGGDNSGFSVGVPVDEYIVIDGLETASSIYQRFLQTKQRHN